MRKGEKDEGRRISIKEVRLGIDIMIIDGYRNSKASVHRAMETLQC